MASGSHPCDMPLSARGSHCTVREKREALFVVNCEGAVPTPSRHPHREPRGEEVPRASSVLGRGVGEGRAPEGPRLRSPRCREPLPTGRRQEQFGGPSLQWADRLDGAPYPQGGSLTPVPQFPHLGRMPQARLLPRAPTSRHCEPRLGSRGSLLAGFTGLPLASLIG